MPITISIEGANASEVRQLVADLASIMPGVTDDQFPTDTKFSTVEGQVAEPVQHTQPAQQAPAPAAGGYTQPTPTAVPAHQAVPTAVPTAAPTAAPEQQAAPTSAPTSAPQYDFNQLATATMQLQQGGHNVFEFFSHFGIQALNQLPKERFAEYAAFLRQKGAQI